MRWPTDGVGCFLCGSPDLRAFRSAIAGSVRNHTCRGCRLRVVCEARQAKWAFSVAPSSAAVIAAETLARIRALLGAEMSCDEFPALDIHSL